MVLIFGASLLKTSEDYLMIVGIGVDFDWFVVIGFVVFRVITFGTPLSEAFLIADDILRQAFLKYVAAVGSAWWAMMVHVAAIIVAITIIVIIIIIITIIIVVVTIISCWSSALTSCFRLYSSSSHPSQ